MDFKSILKNKSIKLVVTSFSASMIMFLMSILFILVFIATIFSGLLGIIIGPIYTHLLQYIIFGLIVPLGVIYIGAFFVNIFVSVSKTKALNLFKNYCIQYPKKSLKNAFGGLIFCIAIFCFFVKQTGNTINAMNDISPAISHNYASIDGVVEIDTDTGDQVSKVSVDGLIFNDGYVFKPGIIDGKKYHVEYLPHTRYIVDFTLIE